MKKLSLLFSFVLIIAAIWYTFYGSMPSKISDLNTNDKKFSTLRALAHVKQLSKTPHYLGSASHDKARDYIFSELRKLGLTPQIQEGFSISKTGSCARIQNIVAKIKGNKSSNALLLVSHYDSSPHSSYGASDAASGVATILEGVRAFLAANHVPENDIIICITDGEELGLNGAHYFANQYPHISDIKLVLNFEARGSGGNSFMLVETNAKNSVLIDHFSKANVPFPVANSLAYSIYKMLPNDTDLTVFRDEVDIEGFNFAFIDDHYDYHSANDIWHNLDLNTLQHQGSYLMALLPYFSEISLDHLKSDHNDIYFNFPLFNMIHYPYSWILPLWISAFLLFLGLLFYGKTQFKINFGNIGKAVLILISIILLCAVACYVGWWLLTLAYPFYTEILQGFTYNGHFYIAAFVLISLGICFKIYARIDQEKNLPTIIAASLLIWLIICLLTSLYLKGASYFIIPVFFSLITLFICIRQKFPNIILLALLSFPAIFIISPFINNLPVAIGLKMVFVSGILTALLFTFLLPVFSQYRRKNRLGSISLLLSLTFIIIAHFKSNFTETRQKPNSLVYIMDADNNKGVWATYDDILDSWTENYIDIENNIAANYNKTTLQNKYGKRFSYINNAPYKKIPEPIVEIREDIIINSSRYINLCIAAKRTINRLDLYTTNIFNFENVIVNGQTSKDFVHTNGKTYNAFTKRWSTKLLTHYISNNESLEINLKFQKDSVPEFVIYESSYNLLENPLFTIPARSSDMMPKPFLLNDAIIVKKSFNLEEKSSVLDTLQMSKIKTTSL